MSRKAISPLKKRKKKVALGAVLGVKPQGFEYTRHILFFLVGLLSQKRTKSGKKIGPREISKSERPLSVPED